MLKPVVVQKYGGSSVGTKAAIEQVAQLIKDKRQAGYALCVVVSAMGKTTDQFLDIAKSISKNPPRRELDMLLTCGERMTMALLAMALDAISVPSISLTGSQSGIITDGVHAGATIVEIRPKRILEALDDDKVVIVAGFQGVSLNREITTLGRGGSDTTAVALAGALEAEACEIYSDVEGVFTADPRVVPQAELLPMLSLEEMGELSHAGARVLCPQAVQMAQAHGVSIRTGKTGQMGFGTLIGPAEVERRKHIFSIAHQENVFWLRTARECSIPWQQFGIVPVLGMGDKDHQHYFIFSDNAHQMGELLEQRPFVENKGYVGLVSIIGKGLSSISVFLEKVHDNLKEGNIQVVGMIVAPMRISVLIDNTKVLEAVRLLHARLVAPQQDVGV